MVVELVQLTGKTTKWRKLLLKHVHFEAKESLQADLFGCRSVLLSVTNNINSLYLGCTCIYNFFTLGVC